MASPSARETSVARKNEDGVIVPDTMIDEKSVSSIFEFSFCGYFLLLPGIHFKASDVLGKGHRINRELIQNVRDGRLYRALDLQLHQNLIPVQNRNAFFGVLQVQIHPESERLLRCPASPDSWTTADFCQT